MKMKQEIDIEDLDSKESHVYRELQASGPLAVWELCNRTKRSRSSVTDALGGLRDKDLVECSRGRDLRERQYDLK